MSNCNDGCNIYMKKKKQKKNRFSERCRNECVKIVLYCGGGVHILRIKVPQRCAWKKEVNTAKPE